MAERDNDWLLPADLQSLLSETNHEICVLADGIVRLLKIERDDDFLMYHGMLARIQQLSTIQFHALRLHGDKGKEAAHNWGASSDDLRHLGLIYRGIGL